MSRESDLEKIARLRAVSGSLTQQQRTEQAQRQEDRRAEMRLACPRIAEVFDLFEKSFGVGSVRVVYAKEGGRVFGRPSPGPHPFSPNGPHNDCDDPVDSTNPQ